MRNTLKLFLMSMALCISVFNNNVYSTQQYNESDVNNSETLNINKIDIMTMNNEQLENLVDNFVGNIDYHIIHIIQGECPKTVSIFFDIVQHYCYNNDAHYNDIDQWFLREDSPDKFIKYRQYNEKQIINIANSVLEEQITLVNKHPEFKSKKIYKYFFASQWNKILQYTRARNMSKALKEKIQSLLRNILPLLNIKVFSYNIYDNLLIYV